MVLATEQKNRTPDDIPLNDAVTSGKDYILSVFPNGRPTKTATSPNVDGVIQWYSGWLNRQLQNLPSSISGRLRSFPQIFRDVAELGESGYSIDDIATSLLQSDLIGMSNCDEKQVSTLLVFAIIGWQTMLYQAAFQTCPPQQLAVADVLDGYIGQAFMKLKQDQSQASRCLSDFLLGFGLMLPKEDMCISDDPEDCGAFENISVVDPSQFNASLLHSMAQIKIKWVDVIAPHLEFDKATNTMFLFRYPSFCMANISPEHEANGVIHGCAAVCGDNENWASKTEVTQFLHEILLSYRLLFGQSKDSRRLFQSLHVFEGMKPEEHDLLLQQLCCNKSFTLPSPTKEREFYRLRRDFPVLRSRIASLQQHVANFKPRGWREIWKDKRDSAQWYTFWAVIIFGGLGIILSLAQTVLQAAQLAGSQKP